MVNTLPERRGVIVGTPRIGEGNVVDTGSFAVVLKASGIPVTEVYADGPAVRLARHYHRTMTMSTRRTIRYASDSDRVRASLMVLPLINSLKRAVSKALRQHDRAGCFLTSQSMMAEASAAVAGPVPTLMASSDAMGKFIPGSRLSELQRRIIYLVWNRDALGFYQEELKLPHVHLIKPVDPLATFGTFEREKIPFRDVIKEPALCYIKLSGSGGDPVLINGAIRSLWRRANVMSIVFPGAAEVEKKILRDSAPGGHVRSSLDTAAFYHMSRMMIPGKQMLLTYPSEQVKHLSLLSQCGVYPRVVWLPPRGQHEVMSLAWAIKQGFPGTVCLPGEYHRTVKGLLTGQGVSFSDIECVEPDRLSTEHFRPVPRWNADGDSVELEDVVRRVAKF